ncbi:MAG TPA: O-methyltransferase [Bacteroidia bacterium]|nr:O-methyltransferase [Bacteroidia bacterium]
MEFLDEKLTGYIDAHTAEEPAILAALNRETWAKILMPRMLSGHLQGRVLSMLSHMIRPASVLEIGTYTGYSAICLAEGLASGGTVTTIDINDELEEMVKRYIDLSGNTQKITALIGDATQLIPAIDRTFDLVFIDADKENYSNYFDLVINKVRPGGYIIADNVLWSGNVLQAPSEMDAETRAIFDFNNKIHSDSRVAHVLFPVRDGLMICRKL